jgi:hypothetical protein
MLRTFAHRGRRISLVGIKYHSAEGGDALFNMLNEQRPRAVLMESFHTENEAVAPGRPINYRAALPPAGIDRATQLVASENFRATWTAEAVATLAALRIGAEVRCADRALGISFERIARRRSLDELRHDLIAAVEGVCERIEAEGERTPQNALCPHFPELWGERHALFAHFARQAVQLADGDVALVCGAEHVPAVGTLLDASHVLETDPVQCADAAALAADLLRVDSGGGAGDEEADALEKRAALAALLIAYAMPCHASLC